MKNSKLQQAFIHPKKIILRILILIILIPVSISGCKKKPKPVFKLDHFLVYETPTGTFQDFVELTDQFGPKDSILEVKGPVAFVNPVRKTYNNKSYPILNPDHHFAVYFLTGLPEPERHVLVSNQFIKGKKKIKLGQPIYLMVPTQKLFPKKHKKPQKLDHYVCYEIKDGKDLGANVDLKDQFASYPNMKVGKEHTLCVPVEKTYKGILTPVLNFDDHLLCYVLPGEIKGNNQFHSFSTDLSMQLMMMLCVPTKKELINNPNPAKKD